MPVKAFTQTSKKIMLTLCTLFFCYIALTRSTDCSEGALKGIEFCLKVLIPSLFPFMAICSFIVNSRLHQYLGKPFQGVMHCLFGLSGNTAPIILLSLIGGYPVGAKGIASLYSSGAINEQQAKKAVMFCVCAGPGFLINYVGNYLYQNKTVGLILLCSQILSVFILGISINIFARNSSTSTRNPRRQTDINIKNSTQIKSVPISTSVVKATAESSRGLLSICVFVVIFSSFTQAIAALISNETIKNTAICLTEVCSAVNTLSKGYPIEAIALAVGFGGLCVHFQIFSVIENIAINKLHFFAIRITQGVITALFTHIGLSIFSDIAPVFSTATVKKADIFGGTIISGLALIFVSVCFLFSLKEPYNKSHR